MTKKMAEEISCRTKVNSAANKILFFWIIYTRVAWFGIQVVRTLRHLKNLDKE